MSKKVQQEINIDQMTVVGLKALAYDIIATIEKSKADLTAVNNMIKAKMEAEDEHGETTGNLGAAEEKVESRKKDTKPKN